MRDVDDHERSTKEAKERLSGGMSKAGRRPTPGEPGTTGPGTTGRESRDSVAALFERVKDKLARQ